jgi:histidinol-phosphate aminotransferase
MSIIKPHILAMSAYKPPLEGRNPKSYTLLDFNERTIPVSQPIVDALQAFIGDGRLQQYPAYGDIVERLASYARVNTNQVMITNGSDQGIDLIFRAVAKVNAEAIIPVPSFAMYQQCANVEAMHIVEPQYTKEQGYPLREVLAAITPNTAIIVISNPNNPCGTLVTNDVVEQIAKAAPQAAILVDECYYEYSGQSSAELIDKLNCSNIFITRTFSKTWGIPSLRFGYILANTGYIDALCNIRGPYDINQLAIVAANAALDNPEYTEQYVEEVMHLAKPQFEAWLAKNNIGYWPSQANYVWAFFDDASAMNDYLKQNNILVRAKVLKGTTGLRITMGTVAQTDNLIDVCEQFFKLNTDE